MDCVSVCPVHVPPPPFLCIFTNNAVGNTIKKYVYAAQSKFTYGVARFFQTV